ncbi:alpha-galactosidase [Actinospica sp. MGRD01-02]|uniref:Alpha-galactosidase n=1 Tax=Actinospica acidithermotolerans TaxID=2828514 RepID=A0A941ILS0_9ACTN|nr:glycoside hydrolase family 36 protein [Actinospica acidithermotolerans]MBR7827891.1 alpha-galactosidase [Actinospica acidithermotolerans]
MPDDVHLLHFGARTIAARLESAPNPVEGGLILPAGRIALLHGMPEAQVYRHGWNSWSPCGWRAMDAAPLRIAAPERRLTADDTDWDDPRHHHSAAVTALADTEGNVLLVGALGLDVPRLTITGDTIVGWYERDGAEWFAAYGPELEVFTRYARLLGRRLGGERHRNRAGNVWCSWYAYHEGIDQETLRADLKSLKGLPFDVFQIDDGWERMVGDWQPNEKFPDGMADLATRARDLGLRPGLWLAPFIARPQSALARERPHLLVTDKTGAPAAAGYNWGGPYYALDLTLPEAQDHVRDLISTVVGWGYQYLKLDFVNAAAVPGARNDPDRGREAVYRAAMELVREAAGPQVYLLGSGAPALASLGVCDGIRIGPDVAPFWTNYATDDPSDALAENALVTSIHRLWLRDLVDLDPDVVYFRARHSLLTPHQRELLADLARVCAFKATSDPVGWLDPEERIALAEFLARDEPVRQLSRYRFDIGGREVDFTAAAERLAG